MVDYLDDAGRYRIVTSKHSGPIRTIFSVARIISGQRVGLFVRTECALSARWARVCRCVESGKCIFHCLGLAMLWPVSRGSLGVGYLVGGKCIFHCLLFPWSILQRGEL